MQYVVVTGGSKGMGRAIAERFLTAGCAVAVCARNEADLRSAVNEWRHTWPDADIIWQQADISTTEGVNAFSQLVLRSFPQIDVLVNNAGAYVPGSLIDGGEEVLENMLSTNLWGAYRLARAFVPGMRAQKSGHIVNICSVASLKGYNGIGAYSISKYALIGLSDNLREELRPFGIKVTSLCPGATWTSSWDGSDMDPARIMEAGDIAEMVWTCSSMSTQAAVETIVLRPQKGDV